MSAIFSGEPAKQKADKGGIHSTTGFPCVEKKVSDPFRTSERRLGRANWSGRGLPATKERSLLIHFLWYQRCNKFTNQVVMLFLFLLGQPSCHPVGCYHKHMEDSGGSVSHIHPAQTQTFGSCLKQDLVGQIAGVFHMMQTNRFKKSPLPRHANMCLKGPKRSQVEQKPGCKNATRVFRNSAHLAHVRDWTCFGLLPCLEGQSTKRWSLTNKKGISGWIYTCPKFLKLQSEIQANFTVVPLRKLLALWAPSCEHICPPVPNETEQKAADLGSKCAWKCPAGAPAK